MRDWPKYQPWFPFVFLVAACWVGCGKSPVPTPQEQAAPAVSGPSSNLSRTVPRRPAPLIVTNHIVLQEAPGAETNVNTAPVVTCGGGQSYTCVSPEGIQVTLTAHVEDVDADALSVIWNIDGRDRFTQQVAAGGPPTAADLTYVYTLTQGEHRVKVTAQDGSLAGSCETTIVVQPDTEDPMVACPNDLLVAPDPGQCTATVNFSATATDNCAEVSVVCDPPPGSTFPIGLTAVTCTATDAAGNTAACGFQVSVQVMNRCPRNEGYWRQNPGTWPLN
jgi:hypothetical protein